MRGKLKVSSAAEDALTATVFGLLSAAPWDVTLRAWLETSTGLDGTAALRLPDGEPEVVFWPTFRRDDLGDCEPDVVLQWADGCRVLIESKLGSPPSGAPSGSGPVTGQLGRQWLAASQGGTRPHAQIYITEHWTVPRSTLADHANEVSHKAGDDSMRNSLYWLPWRTLRGHLRGTAGSDETAKRVLARVGAYLEWLHLDTFQGFGAGTAVAPGWGYTAGER